MMEIALHSQMINIKLKNGENKEIQTKYPGFMKNI